MNFFSSSVGRLSRTRISVVSVLLSSVLAFSGAAPASAVNVPNCGADYNHAMNGDGGRYSGEVFANEAAFAALKTDGSITAWGNSGYGGSGAPTDSGYTNIYSTRAAFAALKTDGSITAWGDVQSGGSGAPTDSGYVKVFSNRWAFVALKSDGSITAWGNVQSGGSGAPIDSGYEKVYSTDSAFAAVKSDGSITGWGFPLTGGSDAPTDSGYTNIYSTQSTFVAVKADGTLTVWGSDGFGNFDAPTDSGYVAVHSTNLALAALKDDGSISAWGSDGSGGSGAPTDSGYTNVYSTDSAFAALKADGSITAWGNSEQGGSSAPTDSGYTTIYSNRFSFVALKADGTLTAWGRDGFGGSDAPSDSGFVQVHSARDSYAALKVDGSLFAWGYGGGTGAPTDSGYVNVYSTILAFVAVKADGSLTSWGFSPFGGDGAPTDSGYVAVNGAPRYKGDSCLYFNNVPTDIGLDNALVVENSASGSLVGSLSTIDSDSSDTHTYNLESGAGDEDNSLFTINGDKLKLAFAPDYEKPVDVGDVAANNTYSVRVKTDDGMNGTYEKVFTITVTNANETEPVDGFTVSGKVFVDTNRNGVLDSGETDLSGVKVSLINSKGVKVETVVTASPYTFTGVAAGDYTISFDKASLPIGMYPVGLSSASVSINKNISSTDLAVNYAQVSGVLTDKNGTPVPDTEITLTDSEGNVFKTLTGSDGSYTFTGSADNILNLGEVSLTATVNGQVSTVIGNVQDGSTINADLQAGIADGVELTGRVFVDADRDGKLDATEQDVSGVEVILLDSEGITVNSALTSSPYSFTDVSSGEYTVSLNSSTLPEGFFPTGETSTNITVGTQNLAANSFGSNYAQVTGFLTDEAGTPVGAVDVTLTDSQGNTFTVKSAEDGSYTFTGSEENILNLGEVNLSATANGQTTSATGEVTDGLPIRVDLQAGSQLLAFTGNNIWVYLLAGFLITAIGLVLIKKVSISELS